MSAAPDLPLGQSNSLRGFSSSVSIPQL